VVTVTNTPKRVEQMLEALNRVTEGKGSNMFLFTDEHALVASNPLDVEWVVGKDRLVKLTD
jgi:2-C-methyl-D-erythritol 4-phosphate cytidylyltransferase